MSFYDFAIRSMIVALAGVIVLVFARKASSSHRHLIAVLTATAVIAIAPLSGLQKFGFIPIHVRTPVASAFPTPIPDVAPVAPVRKELGADSKTDAGIAPKAPPSPTKERRDSLTTVASAGSLLFAAYIVVGLMVHLSLRRRARGHDAVFRDESTSAGGALKLSRLPKVVLDPQASVPYALVGWPSFVVLPLASRSWSSETLRSVLLHEFAHVKRNEAAWHLLVECAYAAQWWNPLLWILRHCARHEAEKAADDMVLSAGVRPTDYATDLVQIAKAFRRTPANVCASPMILRPAVGERVHSVLEKGRNRGRAGRADIIFAGFLTLLLAGGVAAGKITGASPQVVEFPRVSGKPSRLPGDASNGFVCKLDQEHSAKVVEVFEYANGERRSWRADGTPIPGGQSVMLHRRMIADLGPQVIVQVPGYERTWQVDFEGDPGNDSYRISQGESFIGSHGEHFETLRMSRGTRPNRLSFSLRLFGKTKEIVGIVSTSGAVHPVLPPAEGGAKWSGHPDVEIWKGKVDEVGKGLFGIEMHSPAPVNLDPWTTVSPGNLSRDGKPINPPAGRSGLRFRVPFNLASKYRLSTEAVLRNGDVRNPRKTLSDWDDKSVRYSAYFAPELSEISRFRLYVQTAKVATFYGVALKPITR